MFWVRIRLGGREYLGVLDTGATISIVAKKILPCGSLKNTMTTAAIRMGDGHVVHSCGDCEVEVPMGSRTIAHRFHVMDTEAFDFVLGTDFFVQHSPNTIPDAASALPPVRRPRQWQRVCATGAVGTYLELPETIEGGALEHDGGLQN